jgi:hypothetical protein
MPVGIDPDQSCSQCGARDIQLAPLQREVGRSPGFMLLTRVFADGGSYV